MDDHSTDDTWQYLQNIQDTRLVPLKNIGTERSEARNTGLDVAKGKYICFTDDDDLVSNTYFSDFYDAIQINGEDENTMYRCTFEYIYEDGRKKKKGPVFNPVKHQSPAQFIAYHFCGLWTLAIHRDLALKGRFDPRFPHWQDTHYMLQLCAFRFSLIQINSVNYYYRIHSRMGSLNTYQVRSMTEKAEINVAAIQDFFNHYPTLKSLPANCKDFLMAEKYLEYAVNTLKLENQENRISNSFILLKQSLKKGIYSAFFKNYIVYLYNLLKTKLSI